MRNLMIFGAVIAALVAVTGAGLMLVLPRMQAGAGAGPASGPRP